jgi:type I restriction enzyme M protein
MPDRLLDCKNPHQETIEHGDPETLMNDYLAISQKLAQAQQALKDELVAALERESHD